MTETGEALPSDQNGKKRARGGELTTGKRSGQRSGMALVVFLPQLSHESENEKETKRRPRGERRKIGSPFVVLKMRLMKMDGPQYGVKAHDGGVRLMSHIGLITLKIIILVLQPV